MKRVTIPTTPWDEDADMDDPRPMLVNPPKIKERLTPATARTPTEIIATRCFTGNMNASDLRYMALALLQLQDELCEARERIRRLESER